MASFMLWPVYPWGKCSLYPLYRSLVGGPRASLDVLEWEKSYIPTGIKPLSLGHLSHNFVITLLICKYLLTLEHHIGELTTRLNKTCYAIRSIKPFISLDVLRSTYLSYAHSVISYRIIFWGNSSYCEDIFEIQKIIIRIIVNSSRNVSCQQLFKDLKIISFQFSPNIYI